MRTPLTRRQVGKCRALARVWAAGRAVVTSAWGARPFWPRERSVAWKARGFGRAMDLTGRLGKWAMLDVFVLALVVFAVQSQGLASALVLPGAYCFAGAALLSMVVTYRLQALARPAGHAAAGEVTGP